MSSIYHVWWDEGQLRPDTLRLAQDVLLYSRERRMPYIAAFI